MARALRSPAPRVWNHAVGAVVMGLRGTAMKKFSLIALGLLALGATAPASAADLRVKAPPPAPPVVTVYNWTGFYIGGHVGGAWVDHDVFDPLIGLGVSIDKSGFLGGGQVGFNYQPLGSNWVFGVEGDIAWVDIDNNHICPAVGFNCNHNHNWLATVTGRLGYAWDTVFLYAKGGAAFVNHEFTGPNAFGILVSESNTRTGWTVGAGLEWGFAPNWSAKVEYNFMDFSNDTLVFHNLETQINVVKVGVNYRFGWGVAPARF
jgi:outer membrane immunogenic protein